MEVVVDDRRLSDARRRNRLVEQRMPVQTDERAGDHDRRKRVFALLTRTVLTVLAAAERRRIELHTIGLPPVVLRPDRPRPIELGYDLAEEGDEGRVLQPAGKQTCQLRGIKLSDQAGYRVRPCELERMLHELEAASAPDAAPPSDDKVAARSLARRATR
jgi:hypothetical protein